MAITYCKHCGTDLSPRDKFCSNCGQPLDAAPKTTQKAPPAPKPLAQSSPPLTPSSRLGAAFWLGLIGAIFGLLIGAFYLWMSTISIFSIGGDFWPRTIGVIVFSILGIVGPLRIIEKGDTVNAGLMIIAGVGMLICVRQLGILSALLFFIGAVLILLKKG